MRARAAISVLTLSAATLSGCVAYPAYPTYQVAQTAPVASNAPPSNCREEQHTVVIDGKQQQAFGTACQQADGTWRLVDQTPQPPSQTVVVQQATPYYPYPYPAYYGYYPYYAGPSIGIGFGGRWGHGWRR